MKKSDSLAQELQEVITRHIEQALADNKTDDTFDGYPYQVIFAANDKDDVKVCVRWPVDGPPALSVRTLGAMLHHISEAHWKPPMISAVNKTGLEQKQPEIAGQILQQWGQATHETTGETLCVPPRQVFIRKPQGPG